METLLALTTAVGAGGSFAPTGVASAEVLEPQDDDLDVHDLEFPGGAVRGQPALQQ